MGPNPLKRRLAAGERVIGSQVFEFATTGILRICAAADADYALIDTQHSGWTGETLRVVLASARGEAIAPLVRVPAIEEHLVGRALDLGAVGIMAPNVETAEDARRLVRFACFPPLGVRGAAFGLSGDDFRPVADLRSRMTAANDEVVLIALVESVAGVEHLDEIAAVEGIDVVWLGQFDLTVSMGIPGDFTHPRYAAAVDALLEACRVHGKAAGFMATSVDEGRRLLDRGFRCVSYANDVRIFRNALAAGVAELKGHPAS